MRTGESRRSKVEGRQPARGARTPTRSTVGLRPSTSGFVLFEAMLAVAIFAIGILALGECLENCLRAEQYQDEEARARRVLANRLAEIEAGAVPLKDSGSEELKGAFAGMTLKHTRKPFKAKNEDNKELMGIQHVTLEVLWKSSGEEQRRALEFFYTPRQG